MNLKRAISPELVEIGLAGTTKREIIESLVDLACRSGKVADRETALDAVLEREKKMSTGMQHGIAIPHAKTDTVDELVACIAISGEPVDFESLDGKPSRIFICTLSPTTRSGPHIQFLAEVSKLLSDESRRSLMLAAKTPEDVIRILTR
jgi:PTS system nitrogen regulatory IIA component